MFSDSLSITQDVIKYFEKNQNWIIPLIVGVILVPFFAWTFSLRRSIKGRILGFNYGSAISINLVFENTGRKPVKLKKLCALTKNGKIFEFRNGLSGNTISYYTSDRGLPVLLKQHETWDVSLLDRGVNSTGSKGYFVEDELTKRYWIKGFKFKQVKRSIRNSKKNFRKNM